MKHYQVKYLNNIIESDHGKLKRLIKPTLGFKSMKTAYATLKGFEIMLMFKKVMLERLIKLQMQKNFYLKQLHQNLILPI